jgi:hypothetical protein
MVAAAGKDEVAAALISVVRPHGMQASEVWGEHWWLGGFQTEETQDVAALGTWTRA